MKSGNVNFELIVSVVMVALDSRFLDRAVLCAQAGHWPRDVLTLVSRCSIPSAWQRISSICVTHLAVRIVPREGELDPIVGENRMDLVGDSRDQSFEEGRGRSPSRLP